MSKRWLMLLLSSFFTVGMFIGFNCANVYAAEDSSEEISTEADESFFASEGISGEASSDATFESESSDDETESESTSYSTEELESLTDKKKADKDKAEARSEALSELESESETESVSSSSGGSTVIVQEQDDSAVRTLINEFIKGRDTLNGFQKQVLNRLDVISICSVVVVAVVICNFFIRK